MSPFWLYLANVYFMHIARQLEFLLDWTDMEPAPTLTLCSHAGVADSLRSEVVRANVTAGAQSWESPPIHTLNDWLRDCWAANGDRLLLTADQESLLWREIIADDAADSPLLDLAATAASAAEAWRLAHAWQWDWSHESGESDETAAFRGWAAEFRRRIQRGDWITSAELPAPAAPSSAVIQLAGFDRDHLTPRHQILFNALAADGARIEYRAAFPVPARPVVATASDAAAEVDLAARWARQRLEEGIAGPIGVIVPDLAQRRAEVERTFTQAFHPDLAPWDASPRAFHLSLGLPLSAAPMLGAALSALRSLGEAGPLPLFTVLDLIRSPFLAAADNESYARARLENHLRLQRRPAWAWTAVVYLAGNSCPVLARSLAAALKLVRRWPGGQNHQSWIESFISVWSALGWPGERPLDGVAGQTLHAWERLLDDFGRLDQVSSAPIPAPEALLRLESCAAARPFQPPAAPAPVQVLGGGEAAGVIYNDLWVCGLDDETFPARPHPNPFLPLDWQRRAGVPHASAAIEEQSASLFWQNLRHHCASPELIASYAVRAGDGHERRPSPPLVGAGPWGGSLPTPAAIAAPELEPVADAQAPPALPGEAHGPSDLLRDQSACPFRAFAHYRLHVRRAPSPEPGLASATRGSLLHKVLADLWSELGGSDGLRINDALRQRIAALADAAVKNEHGLDPLPGLAAVECERLTETVYAWCRDIESARQPFQVLATEKTLDGVPFAGLKLDLRRDRVDALASGGRMLLDYKSSEVSKNLWKGDRPEEPQVPLYLAADSDPASVAAVAFAQVRNGDMELIGLQGDEIPRVDWNRALTGLAASYLAGAAAVLPRDATVCEHCDLHALCRIRDPA